jgi:pathogenesis-related protein 1
MFFRSTLCWFALGGLTLLITNNAVQAQTGSRLTQQEVQTVLDLHNKARAEAGVQEQVTWDPQIAQFAQAWADNIASRSAFEHRSWADGPWKQKYGENLAGGFGDNAVATGVGLWLAEKSKYNGQAMDGQNYQVFGHYTQMIWQNTRKIGCGKAYDAQKKMFIIVCNYDPPGNYTGQKPVVNKTVVVGPVNNPPVKNPPVVGNNPPATWKENFGPNSGGPFLVAISSLTNKNAFDKKLSQSRANVYSGILNQNREYTFKLESKAFDTYLRVEDANGREVAFNDDSNGTLNSLITFRPPQTGTYRVIVTSFNGGANGQYQLSLSSNPAGGANPPAGGTNPPVNTKSDWRVPGPNEGGILLVSSDFLNKTTPFDTRLNQRHAKVYTGLMDKTRSYTIKLESKNFDTYLRIEDANGKEVAFNDDSNGTLNSALNFRPQETGTYRIIVTTFQPGATGAYQLSLSSP